MDLFPWVDCLQETKIKRGELAETTFNSVLRNENSAQRHWLYVSTKNKEASRPTHQSDFPEGLGLDNGFVTAVEYLVNN